MKTPQNEPVVVADLPGHGLTIIASRCEGIAKHKNIKNAVVLHANIAMRVLHVNTGRNVLAIMHCKTNGF